MLCLKKFFCDNISAVSDWRKQEGCTCVLITCVILVNEFLCLICMHLRAQCANSYVMRKHWSAYFFSLTEDVQLSQNELVTGVTQRNDLHWVNVLVLCTWDNGWNTVWHILHVWLFGAWISLIHYSFLLQFLVASPSTSSSWPELAPKLTLFVWQTASPSCPFFPPSLPSFPPRVSPSIPLWLNIRSLSVSWR